MIQSPALSRDASIHLMRDINDDLSKQPFNEEIKDIARRFASLLQLIVQSVDRFGLKARHLRKHRPDVDRFFKGILGHTYKTEVAAGYQKRFAKNRHRLFTFLDHDGVPWNNNNAEHAVKQFVRLRNVVGGTSTPKGIQEYLVLLSVSARPARGRASTFSIFCTVRGNRCRPICRAGEDLRANLRIDR
jgi:hypothetical protein